MGGWMVVLHAVEKNKELKGGIENAWRGLPVEVRKLPIVFTEMMTFEQRSDGSMGESHADIWGTGLR